VQRTWKQATSHRNFGSNIFDSDNFTAELGSINESCAKWLSLLDRLAGRDLILSYVREKKIMTKAY
jgi:hypothetical protein